MKSAAVLAAKYGKEVWMTEHSSTDHIDHLPTWHEQLLFAEELNECMLSGCTGYIYWYMRAHWSFVGTGEPVELDKKKITIPGNTKNKLLPRAFVMSHFSKHVTGSTRLEVRSGATEATEAPIEYSAYIKGDSLIVMAIDTTSTEYDLRLRLPVMVKSGVHLLSTGNESANLCRTSEITIDEPTSDLIVSFPARSLNTYIFMLYKDETGIVPTPWQTDKVVSIYDLSGRQLNARLNKGFFIEKQADGTVRKVYKNK